MNFMVKSGDMKELDCGGAMPCISVRGVEVD